MDGKARCDECQRNQDTIMSAKCPGKRDPDCSQFIQAPPGSSDFKEPAQEGKGLKADNGKQGWFALPLEILQPLADVMSAGEKKYGIFNCLESFEDPDRRFWDANMRHAVACQKDPLAIDEETGCYHEACRAFSSLMRIYHCRKEQ